MRKKSIRFFVLYLFDNLGLDISHIVIQLSQDRLHPQKGPFVFF